MIAGLNNYKLTTKLFGEDIKLFPNVNDIFELELAYLEFCNLSKDELLSRSAYIETIEGKDTSFKKLLYSSRKNIEKDKINRLEEVADDESFCSNYATHGLFPYKGKFHPQMIKALLNIIGVKKGDWILDPMAGSGTTNIESALMGINSYAIDVSPFCQIMIQTKYSSLTITKNYLELMRERSNSLFGFLKSKSALESIGKIDNLEKKKLYLLAFLAFLDALGYAQRVKSNNLHNLFNKVLQRYIERINNWIESKYLTENAIGELKILPNCDATNIFLNDNSIDGIITSPPYSFALDYSENDAVQLDFLNYNRLSLKQKMIGLKGNSKEEKLKLYFEDMNKFCYEASRVIKKDKYMVIIIGSNTIQTNGIRLEKPIIDSAIESKFYFRGQIFKPIRGNKNIMKDEYILIFQRG